MGLKGILMPGLHVIMSNRLERLSRKMAELMDDAPLSSPFIPETVMVQTAGVKRWLSLEIAAAHGVCANFRYIFPNDLIYDVFSEWLPEGAADRSFQKDVMAWSIMELLKGELADDPDCRKVRSYYEDSEFKLYQICRQVADVFDQYVIYRPGLVKSWEEDELHYSGKFPDEIWQKKIWRSLVRKIGNNHGLHIKNTLCKEIENKSPESVSKTLPRLFVFGISTLPRYHVELLYVLSQKIDVSMLLLNPALEFWEYIKPARTIYKQKFRKGGEEEELYEEVGNALLAATGRLGRDFFSIVNEYTHQIDDSLFDDPVQNTQQPVLLRMIQRDMLQLVNREEQAEATDSPKLPVGSEDDSIIVNSCHSPMREVQVLYDYLLELFNRDSSLKPVNIIVMTPEIDDYAPYIEAVFGSVSRDDEKYIPFSITDRRIRGENAVAASFMDILNLAGSHVEASSVFSIIESEPVRTNFGISLNDLDILKNWIMESGVRWGIDADHRNSRGLPAIPDNTWRTGLDRLMLGFAMKGEDYFQDDLIPCDLVEGHAELLGNFMKFVERLFTVVRELELMKTPSQWYEHLLEILDFFFIATSETERDLEDIRKSIIRLSEISDMSGFTDKIRLSVIKSYLGTFLNASSPRGRFMSGGVTFCSMLPLRSVPFRVICLLGMQEGAFPRRHYDLSFDLMAKYYQKGDRSPRESDKYLFLESILSARDRLYISYIGQSQKDDAIFLPSTLVSELIDYAEQGYFLREDAEREGAVFEHIHKKHPLQPFSEKYFSGKDKRLFSYSEEDFLVVAQRKKSPVKTAPKVSFISSEIPQEYYETDLDQIIRFFMNPAKFLLLNRMNIRMVEPEEDMKDTENFGLAGLDKYLASMEVLKDPDMDAKEYQRLFRARGILPHGKVGIIELNDLVEEARVLYECIAEHVRGLEYSGPEEFELRIDPFRIICRIDELYRNVEISKIISYRPAKVKGKDRVKAWIRHLAINAAGVRCTSAFIGKDKQFTIPSLDKDRASPILNRILKSVYIRGLRSPVPFFPETSWAYMEKSEDVKKGLKYARRKWNDEFLGLGEWYDPYCNYLFSEGQFLEEGTREYREFHDEAKTVFGDFQDIVTEE